MKKSIILFVAILLACAFPEQASPDGFTVKPKQVINVTFEKAVHVRGLVVAMLQQLDDELLVNNTQVYVAEVMYQETLYRISGTYEQWQLFFRLQWKYPIDS